MSEAASELDVTLVSDVTLKHLDERQRVDYREFKSDLVRWLFTLGKHTVARVSDSRQRRLSGLSGKGAARWLERRDESATALRVEFDQSVAVDGHIDTFDREVDPAVGMVSLPVRPFPERTLCGPQTCRDG